MVVRQRQKKMIISKIMKKSLFFICSVGGQIFMKINKYFGQCCLRYAIIKEYQQIQHNMYCKLYCKLFYALYCLYCTVHYTLHKNKGSWPNLWRTLSFQSLAHGCWKICCTSYCVLYFRLDCITHFKIYQLSQPELCVRFNVQ